MDPTTIRLPEDTLADLDSEYADYGYSARSDYIRDIIEHRDPPFETTATTDDYARPTTDDYERLRDRVDELEERLDEIDRRTSGLEQRANDGVDIDLSGNASSDLEPWAKQKQTALELLRQADQPLRRSEILERVPEYDIQDRSIWERHLTPWLKDQGVEKDGKGWVLDE